MATKYANTSFYFKTPQTSWYLSYYVDRPIAADSTDETLTITSRYVNRPDLLAKDRYGSEKYLWVFMRRNMNLISDPFYDMVDGLTIFLPTKTRLDSLMRQS